MQESRGASCDRSLGAPSATIGRRGWLRSVGALVGTTAIASMVRRDPAHADLPAGGAGRRQVGLMLSHEQFTISQLVDLGVAAEQAGFALISASDHFQPWQPNQGHSAMAWVTLSALGQRTRRIAMGTAVTCPSFRYEPAVVAQAFASLAELYPGRMYLGLGSGEALNEVAATGQWGPRAERSERLVEAAALIRQLWTGELVQARGKYYQVDGRLYDVPATLPPIFMAASGPKAMRRAGAHADGLITDARTWQQSRGEFEAGARSAGKDPALMPVMVEQFVVVGDRDEAEAAGELWRFLPRAFTVYDEVPDPEMIESRARVEVPVEDVYRDWAVGMDPDVHARALDALFDAGVTTVIVHSGQRDQARVVDFYGKRVLPRVAERRARP